MHFDLIDIDVNVYLKSSKTTEIFNGSVNTIGYFKILNKQEFIQLMKIYFLNGKINTRRLFVTLDPFSIKKTQCPISF